MYAYVSRRERLHVRKRSMCLIANESVIDVRKNQRTRMDPRTDRSSHGDARTNLKTEGSRIMEEASSMASASVLFPEYFLRAIIEGSEFFMEFIHALILRFMFQFFGRAALMCFRTSVS